MNINTDSVELWLISKTETYLNDLKRGIQKETLQKLDKQYIAEQLSEFINRKLGE